jgi:hypothetical protein
MKRPRWATAVAAMLCLESIPSLDAMADRERERAKSAARSADHPRVRQSSQADAPLPIGRARR